MELYFYPEKTEEMKSALRGGAEEGSLYKLAEIIRKIREDLEESKPPKWEVSLKGYIEILADILPFFHYLYYFKGKACRVGIM